MPNDYEPLDLSALCNAGVELYARDLEGQSGGTYLFPRQSPPVGGQSFHGLPFQIGNGGEACFVRLGEDEGLRHAAVTVAVGRTARHVIFAHAVLETDLWRGGPLGLTVAEYTFRYADGEAVRVPIRERFEIGNLPLPWGHYPFLALPDQKSSLADRYAGRWEEVGFRQTEAQHAAPRGYYLWAWANPRPEQPLESIELAPGRPLVVVAGITLGHADEWPFVRTARRPVRITLHHAEDAKRPFDLEVEVDRGVATYAYPLPAQALDSATTGWPGFGSPLNPHSSPAYVQIAATPSATITVQQAGAVLAQARWGDLEAQGAIDTPAARLEIVDPGTNWVQVSVLDDDTSRPVPCRIAFHDPHGVPYAPHGHHAPLFSNLETWHIDNGGDLRLGQVTYAYIDGTCQGWLPRGEVLVDAARGFEYEPLRERVTIEPGQQTLTLRLKRWADMNAERYFSGDTHVHFLSTQGSHTEAAGEDLNVVNLLLSQWGHLFTNTEEFTGRPSVSADGRTIVHASQENRQHLLGHLTLLGVKSPIMPWCSDGPGEAELGGSLDITMSDWADACHAQGGTVVLPHLPTPNGEPATLIATGRADAVEMLEQLDFEQLEYYRYLNGGYRLPLVGGTDRMDAAVPVGLYRTYAYIPPDQEFNYDNWCGALKSGRTFMSGGPLLWFTVDGQPMGSTLNVKKGGTVEVAAVARSIFPIHTLQLVQQGRVIESTEAGAGARELQLRTRLRVEHDTWLAARCGGPGYTPMRHYDRRGRGIMAHTSPIYLTCQDEYSVFDPGTAQYMLTLIEGSLAYIRQLSPQRPAASTTHQHGEADHLAHLERPFHQAREALHRRLHQAGIPH